MFVCVCGWRVDFVCTGFVGTVSFASVRLRNVGLVTKENVSDSLEIHFDFLIDREGTKSIARLVSEIVSICLFAVIIRACLCVVCMIT